MSLNWQADKIPEGLRNYEYEWEGKKEKIFHPKMEKLIWLTLMLRMNYTGDEKKKAEVKRRLAYLKEKDAISPVYIGSHHIAQHPKEWANAEKVNEDHYRYYISESDIDSYWGLWTNAFYSDTKAFSKWKALVDKNIK